MSAVAQLLLNKDWRISGCDLKENELTNRLRQLGITVWIGHDRRHLETVDILVYTSAIPGDNPEMQEARCRGLQVMKRAEILSFLMQDKTVVTVAGMHGKTTVASLASHLLSEAGLSPMVAVGGILQNTGGNALAGSGRFFVAEADESDGSFLHYFPDYSIITNIDYEHLDYYGDFDSIQEAFRCFISQTKQGGLLFCWRDDPYLSKLVRDCKKKAVFFGLGDNADIYASNLILRGLASEFDCFREKEFIGHFKIELGGRHNTLNALSAIALGLELGIGAETIMAALMNYQGTRRRLEIKFNSKEILVLEDYGHHPTEIKATLEAVKLLAPRRLFVVFQPHRYTRTKFLLDSFAGCFDLADFAIITDIYPAGELPIKGISGYLLYERLKSRRHHGVRFLPKEDILVYLLEMLCPRAKNFGVGVNSQDVVIVLGAGDINSISDELADTLSRQAQDKRALSEAYQL